MYVNRSSFDVVLPQNLFDKVITHEFWPARAFVIEFVEKKNRKFSSYTSLTKKKLNNDLSICYQNLRGIKFQLYRLYADSFAFDYNSLSFSETWLKPFI